MLLVPTLRGVQYAKARRGQVPEARRPALQYLRWREAGLAASVRDVRSDRSHEWAPHARLRVCGSPLPRLALLTLCSLLVGLTARATRLSPDRALPPAALTSHISWLHPVKIIAIRR